MLSLFPAAYVLRSSEPMKHHYIFFRSLRLRASARLESAHATLLRANESNANASDAARKRIASLENDTVTLNSTVGVLRGHLEAARGDVRGLL